MLWWLSNCFEAKRPVFYCPLNDKILLIASDFWDVKRIQTELKESLFPMSCRYCIEYGCLSVSLR
jgi:hypothetical protein